MVAGVANATKAPISRHPLKAEEGSVTGVVCLQE